MRKRVGGPGEQHDVQRLEKPFTTFLEGHVVTRKMERDRAPPNAVLEAAIAEDVESRGVFSIAQWIMQW